MNVPLTVGQGVGMSKRVVRCLIADDDTNEIAAVRGLLVSCHTGIALKIAESQTAEQAVDICRQKQVDVVFLDVVFGVQGMSGLQAAAVILKECPHTVIVIRGKHREDTIIDGLRACKPAGARLFFLPKAATEAEAESILLNVLSTVPDHARRAGANSHIVE
jgi:DNA-binding NarL/FixJ family response regulator